MRIVGARPSELREELVNMNNRQGPVHLNSRKSSSVPIIGRSSSI